MANVKIFIAYAPSDSLNYLYYDITDAQGNFTFRRLKRGTEYLIFVKDSISDVHYSVYAKDTAPASNIQLIAENDTTRRSYVLFYVLNNDREPLEKVSVGLFNNKEVFHSDTTNSLAIETLSTDGYGRVVFKNYQAGKYYLRARYNSPLGQMSTDTSFTFSGKGLHTDTILLKTSPNITNTLKIKVQDESGNLLPNISVCLFNNPLLFNAQTCDGSFKQETTTGNGIDTVNNLPEGNYDAYAAFKQNDIDYKGSSTVTVNSSGESDAIIILKKVVPDNQLEITVHDDAGTGVNGTNLYFFTSRKLWEADTTLGYILMKTTGDNGKVTINNMAEGKYYIRARAEFGKSLLKGADSVVIFNSPVKFTKLIPVK